MVAAVSQNPGEDAQIIPVSVFWGQSPDRESSAWKLLFADSWAVTGRLRRLVSILILGRKTRVQFSAPIHMRELVGENKGYELTLRMTQRLLRVHFRNLKSAVIGRTCLTGARWSKVCWTNRWSSRRSSKRPSVNTSPRKRPGNGR